VLQLRRRHKGDGNALRAEAASTPHTVHVGGRIIWQVQIGHLAAARQCCRAIRQVGEHAPAHSNTVEGSRTITGTLTSVALPHQVDVGQVQAARCQVGGHHHTHSEVVHCCNCIHAVDLRHNQHAGRSRRSSARLSTVGHDMRVQGSASCLRMGSRDESGRVPQAAQPVCQRLRIGVAVAKHECLHNSSWWCGNLCSGLADFHATVVRQLTPGSAAPTWWKLMVDSTCSSCCTLASRSAVPSCSSET
jgi:hypothetical protein